jgi:hypothetical protein
MPDKPDPKKLEALLIGVMTKMSCTPDPIVSPDQDQNRIIDADKILLRDRSGKCRGKISADKNGSAGLILSNNEGSAWAWLGINSDGEAFLELKDKKGEIKFKVPVGTPDSGTAAEIPAAVSDGVTQDPAPQSHDSQEVSAPWGAPEVGQAHSIPPLGWKPNFVDTTVYDRLEELERKERGHGFFRAAMLGLLALILATQAFLLMRPQSSKEPLKVESLTIQDQNANLRAWLGEKDGKLAHSLMGKTGQHTTNDPDNQQSLAVSNPGDEDGTMSSPGARATEAVSPGREVAAETEYVGSTTSNKYHYPTCKWARTIKPSHLIRFTAVEEAQKRHYIPCPTCKPPPLSN